MYEVADPVIPNSQSPLTMVKEPGEGRESTPSQLKAEDPDFKEDLSLSQSFQQYEVMGSVLRNSQSSLLAVMEKSETGQSEEREAEKEVEEEEEEKAESGEDSQDRYF